MVDVDFLTTVSLRVTLDVELEKVALGLGALLLRVHLQDEDTKSPCSRLHLDSIRALMLASQFDLGADDGRDGRDDGIDLGLLSNGPLLLGDDEPLGPDLLPPDGLPFEPLRGEDDLGLELGPDLGLELDVTTVFL